MSSLKMKAVNSVKLSSFSMVITGVLQLVQLVVLGRILGPEVFGIIALVQIVIQFSHMYMDMGITDAIIQKEKVSRIELSSLYWFSIAMGFAIFLLLYLGSPIISAIFNEPQLESLIQVVGVSFVIMPFGMQFQTMATKKLDFGNITKIEILSSIMGVSLTLFSAAYLGLGVWSLVVGHIGSSVFKTIPWVIIGFKDTESRPQAVFSFHQIKSLIAFGLYRLGTTTANYFNTKIDQIIIGIMMGPQILGYYSMAMNLIMQPIQKLNPMITKVSFPLFSKIQNDKNRLQKAYLFIIKLIMTLNAPLFAGLIILAPYVIPVLLGEGWEGIVSLVQILAFYGLFRALGNPSGSLFIAVGKVRWSFYWQLSLLFVVPVVVYFSSLTGEITIVAMAMAILRFILFFINYFSRIRFIIGDSMRSLMGAIFIPIIHSGIMMLILHILILEMIGVQVWPMIVITFFAGMLIYSYLVLTFQRHLISEVRSLFYKKSVI